MRRGRITIPAAALALVLAASGLAPQAFAEPSDSPLAPTSESTELPTPQPVEAGEPAPEPSVALEESPAAAESRAEAAPETASETPSAAFVLAGRLGILSSEPLAGGGTRPASVLLATYEGPVIKLDAESLATVSTDAAVTTGDEFVGTVLVSSDDAARLETSGLESLPSTPSDPLANAADAVVVDATVTQRADKQVDGDTGRNTAARTTAGAQTAARAHTLDVIVFEVAGDGSAFADEATLTPIVENISRYWAEQSGGSIPSFQQNSATQRAEASAEAACDPERLWEFGARAFNRVPADYWASPTAARHLIALTSTPCYDGSGGTALGLGTVGYTPHEGGLLWAALTPETGTANVTHELGHNLGLGHSSQHFCSTSVTLGVPILNDWRAPEYTDSCSDLSYADLYDPMSGSITAFCPGAECVSNGQMEALNVVHKSQLGFWRNGEVQTLKLAAGKRTSSSTFTLRSAGSTSGLRGVQLVDPLSGETFYVELRDGTGRDASAWYARPSTGGTGLGVRVLRLSQFGERPSDLGGRMVGADSLVVDPTSRSSAWIDGNFILDRGEVFESLNDAIRLSIVSTAAGEATLEAKFAGSAVIERVSGENRYATSLALSKKAFPTTVPVIYIATGENFPDALAAAPAAAKAGGPLILTPPHEITTDIHAEIQRLKPQRIVVVGASAAVSDAAFNQLEAIRIDGSAIRVDRISGGDRFSTAVAIIKDAFPEGAAASWVSTAWNFPDALSAAAAAGASGYPVALVNGPADSIDTSSSALLTALGVTDIMIAGHTAAISPGIASSLAAETGATVTRHSGEDRFQTSLKVSAASFTAPKTVYLANGYGFADALSGAAVAGADKAPLFVIPPTCVPRYVLEKLAEWDPDRIVLIGGKSALTPAVEKLAPC